MITQEYIVSDLELRLSKSKPSSDLDLTYEQMAYWVDQARDTVTKLYVDEAKSIDNSLIMNLNGLTPYNVGEDVFVDLDIIPLDLKNNRGIVYVEDDQGNFIHGGTQQNNKYLSKMSFTKPSGCTVVYTITGSSLFIQGGGSSSFYNVALVHSELSRTKQPSDRYYVAPSTLSKILELAEEIGLRELTGRAYYDLTQDGKSNATT